MARTMLVPFLALLASIGVQATPAAVNRRATPTCASAYVKNALPTNFGASVEKVQHVAQGGTFGEGASNIGFPTPATHLPDLCAVIISVTNSAAEGGSAYRFGLFLPTSGWNSKMLVIGNGAFAGGINWVEMGQGPQYHMVSMSTDTGHSSATGPTTSNPEVLNWALNKPGRQLDWGYRAMNGSLAIAKKFVASYYQGVGTLNRTYYAGCSTAGRQGLKQIQLDPNSFDGLLIGAPAWDTKHFLPWISYVGQGNLDANLNKLLDTGEYDLIRAAVLEQCDPLDGVQDNIISSPEICAANFNWTSITCTPGNTLDCLTSAQVTAAKRVYGDYSLSNGNGQFIHEGLNYGSELDWSVYLGDPKGFDAQWERYFIYNRSDWSITSFGDNVSRDSIAMDNGRATADKFNLQGFNGKVILYQGLADSLVPPRATTRYYASTKAAMGGNIDSFFRYFQVPGMRHCWTTADNVNSPWMFGAAGQATELQIYGDYYGWPQSFRQGYSTPGFSLQPEYDALLTLMSWSEGGAAPDHFNAVAYNSDFSVYRTRKLCPYPQVAVWDKSKGTDQAHQNNATNWNCQPPS